MDEINSAMKGLPEEIEGKPIEHICSFVMETIEEAQQSAALIADFETDPDYETGDAAESPVAGRPVVVGSPAGSPVTEPPTTEPRTFSSSPPARETKQQQKSSVPKKRAGATSDNIDLLESAYNGENGSHAEALLQKQTTDQAIVSKFRVAWRCVCGDQIRQKLHNRLRSQSMRKLSHGQRKKQIKKQKQKPHAGKKECHQPKPVSNPMATLPWLYLTCLSFVMPCVCHYCVFAGETLPEEREDDQGRSRGG
jgi:hypothetical protein